MATITEQFEALRNRALDSLQESRPSEHIRIQVGSATCENAAGAREVYDEFRKHVAASARDDLHLSQTGCTGRCSREPIVGILVPGKLPVKYEHVNRDLVHEIFTRHVLGGEPIWEKTLDGPIPQPSR
ncbi:MAG: (2Fe-2S) ferredoxin domain-containing protein, partial [Patescibacteria group bacterium]|nr:(2Fe-2S) ferredoxin domain-containing protein [Patescibacteria group bacterium]